MIWTYIQGSSEDTDLENRLVKAVWEGESGTSCKSSIETYALPYVKQITSQNLLYDPGSSNSMLCDNLERWDRVGDGGGFWGSGHVYTYGWLMLMYGKNQQNILRQLWASLLAQLVKNPPALREMSVWSLGWGDPLEKGKATCSSILAWRIPRTV